MLQLCLSVTEGLLPGACSSQLVFKASPRLSVPWEAFFFVKEYKNTQNLQDFPKYLESGSQLVCWKELDCWDLLGEMGNYTSLLLSTHQEEELTSSSSMEAYDVSVTVLFLTNSGVCHVLLVLWFLTPKKPSGIKGNLTGKHYTEASAS